MGNPFPRYQPIVVDENHHYYELAVAFHSGTITDRVERAKAKEALFVIHYGNYDLSAVYEAAELNRKA